MNIEGRPDEVQRFYIPRLFEIFVYTGFDKTKDIYIFNVNMCMRMSMTSMEKFLYTLMF